MIKRCVVLGGLLAVWLLFMGIMAKSALDRLSVPPWGNPSGSATTLVLAGDTQIGQTFTAPLPGLHRIDLLLDVSSADPAQQIAFHLQTDASATEDLWSTGLSLGKAEGKQAVILEFPPIRDSQNKVYHFYLESFGNSPGEPMVVMSTPENMLPDASATLDRMPVTGTLWFQSYYSLRTREKIDLLLSRMAEGRPYLLGAKAFYAGVAAVYVIVLGSLIASIVGSIFKEQERPS
jgi:hypothetical protein